MIRAEFPAPAALADRPRNRVVRGWGMLRAIESFVAVYDGKPTTVTAGETYVAPCHDLAVKWPHRFQPCDPDDVATHDEHRAMLERAAQQIYDEPTSTRLGQLPPRRTRPRGDEPWRL